MAWHAHETTGRPFRRRIGLFGLAALLAGAVVLRLVAGTTFGWPPGDGGEALRRLLPGVEAGGPVSVLDIRLLRVILAVVVGASLATSGLALQGLLRNPLAEPFVLGLSTGAAVGFMGQALIGRAVGEPLGVGWTGAVVGAAISSGIVFAAGQRRGVVDPLGLLLAGVVLSAVNGSIVVMLNYMVGPGGMRDQLIQWMMGHLNEGVDSRTLFAIGALCALGIGLTWRLGRSMDVAGFSDVEAVSLGVAIGRLRVWLFLVASVLAAGAVVLAGPVAFVGLICPHAARLLLGPAHRPLVAGSAMLGSVLILLADTASVGIDTLTGIGRMPVGIFTALLGGPAFIWLLRPRLGRG